jgi:trehalose 6-phosphate phosphatase
VSALLFPRNREVLQQFAWSNVLLAFDFDGTLAPIVTDPRKAALRPSTRALLARVARRYPVVVISGRARADVRRRVAGLGVKSVIGNHGLEPWSSGVRFERTVRRWLPSLRQALGSFAGVKIEDKQYSLAIHYRAARRKREARAAIHKAIAALGPVRIIGGKLVVNVLPLGAPHKGTALERERARLGCDTAVYVGDDETDEDVFALQQPGRLLAVRVGAKKGSLAAQHLEGQRDIDRLLGALLTFRAERAA